MRPPVASARQLLVLVSILRLACAQTDTAWRGCWEGTVRSIGFELRVALVIDPQGDGTSAVLDLVDEDVRGIAVQELRFVGDRVSFAVPALHAGFAGARAGSGQARISGRWEQPGLSLPLVIERQGARSPPRAPRPQEPVGALPYRQLAVKFQHHPEQGLASFRADASGDAAAVALAGTLTLPAGDGPHAAVVLISGSGRDDRDASWRGHRPFLVLADQLTRRGIAVLRCDDRGTAHSNDDFDAATSADFATDVRAALRYLRGRPEVDSARIGLIGHSEGGMVASMVAAGPDASMVACIVLLAAPVASLEDMIVRQRDHALQLAGMSAADREVMERLERRSFAALRSGPAGKRRTALTDAAHDAWQRLSAAAREAAGDRVDNLVGYTLQKDTPWWAFVAGHDPRPDLACVGCPVLFVCGDKDHSVDPQANLPAVRRALAANPAAQVVLLAGVNHRMQPCLTGEGSEVASLEATFATEALATIGDWLAARGFGR